MTDIPTRQIRAVHDERTIRVYQAYNHEIADTALAHGTFVSPPFSMQRMTWIKPSFLWMMYRAGWGYKDDRQVRILAIDISHEGFSWALQHAWLTQQPGDVDEAKWRDNKGDLPVRVQWDPERDLHHNPLPHRAIQIGLKGEAVERYVGEWIRKIMDVTALAHDIHSDVKAGDLDRARSKLPAERPYEAPGFDPDRGPVDK